MKYALIVTGFLRENDIGAFFQFSRAARPDVDVYATCWDVRSTAAPGGLSFDNNNTVLEKDVADRYADFNLKNIQIVSLSDYENNRPYVPTPLDREDEIFVKAPRAKFHFEGGYAQRVVDMFYLNKLAGECVPMEQYDVVIKLRHDIFIDSPLPVFYTAPGVLNIDDHQQIMTAKSVNHYYSNENLTHTDLNPFGLSYQVAWGENVVMKEYMNCFDSLKTMHELDNVDISSYEHTMAYYIQRVMKVTTDIHKVERRYRFIRR